MAAFLESQHRHISTLMRASFESAKRKTDTAKAMNDLLTRTDKDRARDVQYCLRQVGRGDPDSHPSSDPSSDRLCRQVAEVIEQGQALTRQPTCTWTCRKAKPGRAGSGHSLGWVGWVCWVQSAEGKTPDHCHSVISSRRDSEQVRLVVGCELTKSRSLDTAKTAGSTTRLSTSTSFRRLRVG